MVFENTVPRSGNGAIRLKVDPKSRIFEDALNWRCFRNQLKERGFLFRPSYKHGLPWFSLFLEDSFVVNFEDELAIIHEENATVAVLQRSPTMFNRIKTQ